MYDKTKAEAAAYAVEIELLTRALANLKTVSSGSPKVTQEILRRLWVLLDLEEGK
jgi:hypothetical protein